jgi:hypothetical protein
MVASRVVRSGGSCCVERKADPVLILLLVVKRTLVGFGEQPKIGGGILRPQNDAKQRADCYVGADPSNLRLRCKCSHCARSKSSARSW